MGMLYVFRGFDMSRIETEGRGSFEREYVLGDFEGFTVKGRGIEALWTSPEYNFNKSHDPVATKINVMMSTNSDVMMVQGRVAVCDKEVLSRFKMANLMAIPMQPSNMQYGYYIVDVEIDHGDGISETKKETRWLPDTAKRM